MTRDIDNPPARPTCPSVMPGEPGWDDARRAWNLVADQHPAAVAHPESADDVIAAVDFARRRGLRVAAQSTGHGAAELDPLGDALLVKTGHLREVTIDAEARRARVGAGVQWAEVSLPAAEHGLAGLAGSSGTVGVVGYSLGGGLGWLGRRYGLACNSVLAVEIVTADGRLRRVDADHEPELFWALRGGGGGSFGVVTAIEFALQPVPHVEAGALFWPIERGDEVLDAWWAWAQGVPDEVSSIGRLLRVPPLPAIPEFLRGRDFALVEVADLRGAGHADELLAPLRALGPEIDTVATLPASGLGALHMDPEDPVPGAGDGVLLSTVTPETLAALVGAAGHGSGSPLLSVEVRHLGGAFALAAPDGGVLRAIDAAAALYGVGIAAGPAAAAVRAGLGEVASAVAPWTSPRAFQNFAGRRYPPAELFGQGAAARLAAVKAEIDPGDLFLANHPVTAPAPS